MTLDIESTVKLNSGRTLPRLGYGVYEARGKECVDGVIEALKAGYRHVDTAQYYENEDLVRQGVDESGVPRDQVFLTTKYFPTQEAESTDHVYKQLEPSRNKIAGEQGSGGYIDLMLVHSPSGGEKGRANNWAALAKAQKEGWVRDIGVSNFNVKHLESLPAPVPVVNQIELHPWCQQKEIAAYCASRGIIIEAYSPLVRADKKRFSDPVIVKICQKHGKEPAQVLIRWSLQKGYVPLPKSAQPKRIKSNADVYDFELHEEDMKALDGLDQGSAGACTWNPIDQE